MISIRRIAAAAYPFDINGELNERVVTGGTVSTSMRIFSFPTEMTGNDGLVFTFARMQFTTRSHPRLTGTINTSRSFGTER